MRSDSVHPALLSCSMRRPFSLAISRTWSSIRSPTKEAARRFVGSRPVAGRRWFKMDIRRRRDGISCNGGYGVDGGDETGEDDDDDGGDLNGRGVSGG